VWVQVGHLLPHPTYTAQPPPVDNNKPRDLATVMNTIMQMTTDRNGGGRRGGGHLISRISVHSFRDPSRVTNITIVANIGILILLTLNSTNSVKYPREVKSKVKLSL
jgi:hypothetical protein